MLEGSSVKSLEDRCELTLVEDRFVGTPRATRGISIPYCGDLPLYNGRSDLVQDVSRSEFLGLPAVEITYEYKGNAFCGDTYTDYLLWLERRGEWVVIALDSEYTIRSNWDNEEYHGPYRLGDQHKTILQRAFGLSGCADVEHTSPGKLESLAAKNEELVQDR